jgi:hypothetical protein
MKNEKIKLDFELKLAELRLQEIFRELLEIEFYEEQDSEMIRDLVQNKNNFNDLNRQLILS